MPLDASSAARLGQLAATLGRPPVVTVHPEPIEDLEKALGCAIPFELIALLAVEGRRLGELLDLTEGVARLYAAEGPGVARQLGWKHVAFALLVGTPEDWTGEPILAAFEKGASRNGATLVRWVVRKPASGAQPYSLERYLEERWRLTDLAAAPLELVIAPPPSAVVHATHAKFGRGRVVSRAQGKATVEFADGTTRTLAESFLTFES